jgi:hypothetical protein
VSVIHDAEDDSSVSTVGAASAEEPDGLPSTGHQEVDAVLASLEGLQDKPVQEHAAVFEAAHDRLRAVLSEGAEAPAGG